MLIITVNGTNTYITYMIDCSYLNYWCKQSRYYIHSTFLKAYPQAYSCKWPEGCLLSYGFYTVIYTSWLVNLM